MKKFFIYGLLMGLMTLGFTSCNDDEDQLTDSHLTYYPLMELTEGDFYINPIGTPYVDPGYSFICNGQDVSSEVEVSGEVDYNIAGLYDLTYSYTNEDGIVSSVTRTVAVCDPTVTTDISGIYTLQDGSYRNYNGTISAFSGYNVRISKMAPGIFYMSDFLGGYYDQRAGYGSGYAMSGYLQLKSDNSLEVLSTYVPGWGDSADGFENLAYDAASSTLSYDVAYAGIMVFHVVLAQ